MMYDVRVRKAKALLDTLGLNALIFCAPENLRYLCGFTGTDGVLIVTAGETTFLTDSRYTMQAQQQVCADRIVEYRLQAEGVAESLSTLQVDKVGYETSLSVGRFDDWKGKASPDWQWHLCKTGLDQLRLLKDGEEVERLEAAAALNAAAFTEVLPELRPGVTEKDIALRLEFALKQRGAEEKAFDFIVASGVRGAMPHGVASDKRLEAGELVTIDFGCRLNGYHSDETVTVALGEPELEMRRIFDIVLEAHDQALAAVRPGIPLKDLDRIARDHIAAAGYADFFGHGLGHGVGLAVHEAPVVSPRGTLQAEAGMVLTVEPGIYLPGKGGVRIEDTVLVTANGARPLTTIPKTFYNVMTN